MSRKVYELKRSDTSYPEEQIGINCEDTPNSKERKTFLHKSYHKNFEMTNRVDNDFRSTKDLSHKFTGKYKKPKNTETIFQGQSMNIAFV